MRGRKETVGFYPRRYLPLGAGPDADEHFIQLFFRWGLRFPRRGERVACAPGDQVNMHVENGLPARCSVGLEEGQAVGLEPVPEERGDVVDRSHHVSGLIAADVPDVGRVTARQDERMSRHGREAVENGDGVLAFVDLPRALGSCRDLAKEAFRRCVGHARIVQDRRLIACDT